MAVYNAFLGKFSYDGIGQTANITVPNSTAAPLTDADIGKAVTWDATGAGYKLTASGERILGFLVAVDSGDSSVVTIATTGVFEATMAADAIAVGDYVTGGTGGNVEKSYDDVNAVDIVSNCVAVQKLDSTTIVVKL